jgi:hypothetical protein
VPARRAVASSVHGVQPCPLVPEGFEAPHGYRSEQFVIEPLDEHHNVADHAAWTASIDHIRATPGFAGRAWPDKPMSLAENAADITQHIEDFANRSGFAYTVLEPSSRDVIGCIYFYPAGAGTTSMCAPGSGQITPSWTSRCATWSAAGSAKPGRFTSRTTPSVEERRAVARAGRTRFPRGRPSRRGRPCRPVHLGGGVPRCRRPGLPSTRSVR